MVELSVEHEVFCHFFSKRKTCHDFLGMFRYFCELNVALQGHSFHTLFIFNIPFPDGFADITREKTELKRLVSTKYKVLFISNVLFLQCLW